MSKIEPFNNPIYVTRPLMPDINEMYKKLQEIWDDQWLTNGGKQHNDFEDSIKKILNVPNVSVFNNGTIALMVAIQSLRMMGEVITTPFTFPATPHVLMWNNIKPIFCDIDPQTMNIDAKKIESMITPQTSGILAVHIFGIPCDVYAIKEIADKYGLKVIYDAAHAFGIEIDGKGIGNFGDISMFSFHATKLFHTAEGGALTYKSENLKTRTNMLKNFGLNNEGEVVMPGINGKMNEIQAALGLVMLDYIDDEINRRKKLFQVYKDYLMDIEGITCYEGIDGVKRNYQYFVIRINEKGFGKSRDYVFEKLKEYNVFSRKYFYPLCSNYPCYKQLPSSHPDSLPNANVIANEVLALPFYGSLTADDVGKISSILLSMRDE